MPACDSIPDCLRKNQEKKGLQQYISYNRELQRQKHRFFGSRRISVCDSILDFLRKGPQNSELQQNISDNRELQRAKQQNIEEITSQTVIAFDVFDQKNKKKPIPKSLYAITESYNNKCLAVADVAKT